MSLRDDLIPLIDDVRDEVVDGVAGLRLHTVATRLRTWSGASRGLGVATDVDTPIAPKPKVIDEPNLRVSEGGRYEDSDRVVEKISATYTEAQLTGSAATALQEFFWLIDGQPYRLVSIEEKYLGWRIVVRRTRG